MLTLKSFEIYIYIFEKYDYSNKMQYMQIANNIFSFLVHKTSVLLTNMHYIKFISLLKLCNPN